MAPMALFGLGPTELIIILVIVLLLFGGTRLAGLGKSTGRAIKEFKEETKGVGEDGEPTDEVVDAEVVDPKDETGKTPPAVSGQQANGDQAETNGTHPQSQPSQSRSDS